MGKKNRYRKVDVTLWRNREFERLSKGAKVLFFFITTCPETIILPGVLCMRAAGIVEAMGSDIETERPHFEELKPWLECSKEARLTFLPYAMSVDPPANPCVVASWRSAFDELPECELKQTIEKHVLHMLETECDPSFVAAWKLQGVKGRRNARVPQKIAIAARERDKNACRYCGVLVNWNDRKSNARGTLDHVDPAGGDTLENIVVCCGGCNSRKSFRTPEQAGMSLTVIREKSVQDHGSRSNHDPIGAKDCPGPDKRPEQEPNPKQQQKQNQEPGSVGAFLSPWVIESEAARRAFIRWGLTEDDARAIVEGATREGLTDYGLEQRAAIVRFAVRKNMMLKPGEPGHIRNIPRYIKTCRFKPSVRDLSIATEDLKRERELMAAERRRETEQRQDVKTGAGAASDLQMSGV